MLAQPELIVQAHAVIDDEQQRPTERSGGFFAYEAIAAGTVLRAEVWLPEDVTIDAAQLERETAIGRSKKDDYGHIRVEVTSPTRTLGERATTDRGHLVVWLLSDVLLQGDAGEPTTDIGRLAAVLGKALNVSLHLPEPAGDVESALADTHRIESWQSRWSLPRPSLTGLRAGSVIQFVMNGEPDIAAYERVEANGIGERTAEGFGRIALQPRLLETPRINVHPIKLHTNSGSSTLAGDEPNAEQTAEVREVVNTLLVLGWRQELHRCAMAIAQDPKKRAELVPPTASSAQLSTLRTLADRVHIDGDTTGLLAWIDGLNAERQAK